MSKLLPAVECIVHSYQSLFWLLDKLNSQALRISRYSSVFEAILS